MRLKYLTLCVLGFSLSACSQHVIKTNSATANLEQKAINSINAMYEYPSYDYRGKFNVHVDLDQNKSVGKDDKAVLDANVKQKVDQYLREQKVNLNTAQKQALYETLAQQPNHHRTQISSRSRWQAYSKPVWTSHNLDQRHCLCATRLQQRQRWHQRQHQQQR